jgi:predicted dehydrogenase
MACPDIDVVYIATPHSEHYANTLMCMQAGIPTLCEKAFAFNAKEVQAMLKAAQDKQVFLMEALWTLFFPAIVQAKAIVESGQLGEIIHIAADFGFPANYDPAERLFNPALAGGSLLDIGLYPLYFAKHILGQPVDIKAVASFSDSGVDMSCAMSATFGKKATASLFSTFATKTDCNATTLGKLMVNSRFHESDGLTLSLNDQEIQHISCEKNGHGYCYEIEHVHQCLSNNLLQSPLASHQFSLELMQLLDNVRAQIGLKYPGEESFN